MNSAEIAAAKVARDGGSGATVSLSAHQYGTRWVLRGRLRPAQERPRGGRAPAFAVAAPQALRYDGQTPSFDRQTTRPTVLLADDHAIVLEALKRLLEPNCDIVATVTDGLALIEAAQRLPPICSSWISACPG